MCLYLRTERIQKELRGANSRVTWCPQQYLPHCTREEESIIIPMPAQTTFAAPGLFLDLARVHESGLPTLNWSCFASCLRWAASTYRIRYTSCVFWPAEEFVLLLIISAQAPGVYLPGSISPSGWGLGWLLVTWGVPKMRECRVSMRILFLQYGK